MFEIWSDTPVDAPVEKNKREEDPDQDLESLVVPPVLRPAKSFAFYMSVLSLALMALITAWDATSLAIALPAISSQLGGTSFQSFWAGISFMLGDAIAQPIYVSTSDVLGRKGPMYTAMTLFSVGSVIFATAHSMNVLIIGRLFQGIGAGGLDVLQDIILTDITSLKERPRYIGIIGMSLSMGMVLGPILGALLSEFVDWRWIGWINLPIIGISFLLAFFFLHLRRIDMALGAKLRRLDWGGMGLFTIGATALSLPLSWGSSLFPWSSWQTIVPSIIGVVLLVFFGFYEKWPAAPMMPYRLFSNTTAVISLLTGALNGAIIYGILQYVPLYFQAVFLEAPLRAAESTLPVCVLAVAFSIITPVMIDITRCYRMLIWLGWFLTMVFSICWCFVDKSTSRVILYSCQALLGAGVGIIHIGTLLPMQASVGCIDDTGLAVGMLVVFRLFGALIGLAASSSIFNSVFLQSISALGTLPEQADALMDATQAISFIPSLRSLDLSQDVMADIVDAYQKPFLAVWIFFTCLSGLGLFSSAFMRDLSLETEELGRQGFSELY